MSLALPPRTQHSKMLCCVICWAKLYDIGVSSVLYQKEAGSGVSVLGFTLIHIGLT